MDTNSAQSEVDIERLLAGPAHVVWVKALAARLIRDDSDRDDAVQDSLLATWAKRASIRFPRAFAAVYLRSAGAHTTRGRARRFARERESAVAEASADPARLVEQADLYALLIRKLAALEKPYRSALVMRYVDDLDPNEIARRAGVPAATIRSRLQRGLEKLRAELDVAHGGDRDAWARAFIVLLPARVGATALVATPLAAGLVLFASFLLMEEPVVAPIEFDARAAERAHAADADGTGATAPGAVAVEASPAVLRTDLAPHAPSEPTANPTVREHHVVVCDIGGRPIAGARVTLGPSRDARDAELLDASAMPTTFADGAGCATITFDPDLIDVADRELGVAAMGYGAGRFAIDATNAEQRLSLFDRNLECGPFELVDTQGKPVVGAVIAKAGPTGEDVVTDAQGRFEGPIPQRDQVTAEFTVRVEGRVGERVEIGSPEGSGGLRRCALGPAVVTQVIVSDAMSGASIANAEISERGRYPGIAADRVLATTDGGGRANVLVGTNRDRFSRLMLIVVRASGYPPVLVDPAQDAHGLVAIRLSRGTTLAGVVIDAATRSPIGGARVLLQYAGPRSVSTSPDGTDHDPSVLVPERGVVLRADGAGLFERSDLPVNGTYVVSIIGNEAYDVSQRAGTLMPGVTRVELAGIARKQTARGRVVGTLSFNGTRGPVPYRWSASGQSGSGHANSDGSYAIERVTPGTFVLTVFVPGICEQVEKAAVAAGETATVDVALTTALAHVRGRAVRADGSVVPFLNLSFQGPNAAALRSPVQACTDAQGMFEAWLPIEPKSPIEIVPHGTGIAKAPLGATAGDESILIVVPAP